MRVRDDSLLAVTLALRNADTAAAAVEALRGNPDPAAVEGLYEAAWSGPPRVAAAALAALGAVESPLLTDAVRDGLASRFPLVRAEALRLVGRFRVHDYRSLLRSILEADESWPNRRAALGLLARSDVPKDWYAIFPAVADPHWRVRHAFVQELLDCGPDDDRCREMMLALAAGTKPRVRGVVAYLRWRWGGTPPSAIDPPDPSARCPFWDWDPAVLARRLEDMGRAGRRAAAAVMPFLVGHEDEWVWRPAVAALREGGGPAQFAETLAHLDDPRTGAEPAIRRLFDGLDGDTVEEIVRVVADLPSPSRAQLVWASESCGPSGVDSVRQRITEGLNRLTHVDPHVAAAARRIARGEDRDTFLPAAGGGPIERHPANPLVRAVALTPERAAELVADPHRETSWHVLDRACRLAKVPLWEIEPTRPWVPPVRPPAVPAPIAVTPVPAPHRAYLGRERLEVSRVGVSGHYLLPAEGFARAAEAGVNWFFWEPNYDTLTDFSTRLSPSARDQLHFVAGTFEAEGPKVRKDVERALRSLRVDRLGLFLVFWVQSWDRLTDDVRDTVDRLRQEGKVAVTGLSSHNRPLLVRAMEEGWNPVMARHSAAHRGAEESVFPKAAELGTTLITFNNLCYGRMLRPVAGLAPPDPADCYRYTLSFPAVSACWSAPSTVEQLDANLRALAEPELPQERREYLRRFGDELYREETAFRRLVRML